MSTIECGPDLKTIHPAGAELRVTTGRETRLWTWVKAAFRAIRNRMATNPLQELDDYQLADIGVTRHDVNRALNHSGVLDDPSLLLSNAARQRARTRFQRPAHH